MAGKTDTRQKMINMMYLVFIAMLALNISKEVLATLGILNDDLESSIVELESSSKINLNDREILVKDYFSNQGGSSLNILGTIKKYTISLPSLLLGSFNS